MNTLETSQIRSYVETEALNNEQEIVSLRKIGSHMYGVNDTTSSLDLMCLYVNNPKLFTYVGNAMKTDIQDEKNNEKLFGQEVEVNIQYRSWRKFMRDILRSKPYTIEFLQSQHIIYEPNEFVMDELYNYVQDNYNREHLYYNYKNIGEKMKNVYILSEYNSSVEEVLMTKDRLVRAEYIATYEERLPPINTIQLGTEFCSELSTLVEAKLDNTSTVPSNVTFDIPKYTNEDFDDVSSLDSFVLNTFTESLHRQVDF